MMAFIYCLTTFLGFYLLQDKIDKLKERVLGLEQTIELINWNDEVDKDEIGVD